MAPEQAEGRVAGVEADLYSLALVLYEALTGVNPVATATARRSGRGAWPCTCRRCAASAATFRASSARASTSRCVPARASAGPSPSWHARCRCR